MEKWVIGIIVGIAAGIWVLTFQWAHHGGQALMIFVTIMSAVRVVAVYESHKDKEPML